MIFQQPLGSDLSPASTIFLNCGAEHRISFALSACFCPHVRLFSRIKLLHVPVLPVVLLLILLRKLHDLLYRNPARCRVAGLPISANGPQSFTVALRQGGKGFTPEVLATSTFLRGKLLSRSCTAWFGAGDMAASSGPKLWTVLAFLPRGRPLGACVSLVPEEGEIPLLYLCQLSPWARVIVASGRDQAWLCRPAPRFGPPPIGQTASALLVRDSVSKRYVPMPRCCLKSSQLACLGLLCGLGVSCWSRLFCGGQALVQASRPREEELLLSEG